MRLVVSALLLAVALSGCRLESRSAAPAQPSTAESAGEAPALPSPTPVSGVAADNPVVLYVTEWCPYCAQARDYMAAEDIPHTIVDIEKDPEGARAYQALGGDGGIPLVAVGPQTMKGWSAEVAREMLDTAGYE